MEKVPSKEEDLMKISKKRPTTGMSRMNKLSSAGNHTIPEDGKQKQTKEDLENGSNDKRKSVGRPPTSGAGRPKEVGKVKPIRIVTTPESKSQKELNAKDKHSSEEKIMEVYEIDGDDLSLIEEKLASNSVGTKNSGAQTAIDPTKDFYSNTGCSFPSASQDTVAVNLNPDAGLMNAIEKCDIVNSSNSSRKFKCIELTTISKEASGGSSERVKVIVRSRPLSRMEIENGHDSVVQVHLERNEIEVRRPKSTSVLSSTGDAPDVKVFSFDSVYDSRISQGALYEDAFKPLVDSVLEGFNGTIFAYGQTGTGKTYTMEGIRDNETEQGVIPNAFRHIFSHVAENSSKQYLIRASYLEIYQEEIRDLLSKDRKQHRELRESPTSGVYVKDLSTFLCSNFGEINDLMTRGNKNRAVGATNMNEHSSRSHAIFMITIEMSEKWADGRNHFKVGKLNLVDLAGSERQGKTGASGERLKEATKINLSLSALGNVIAALVDGKSTHIPYRDSKLTRLLQDSLGGNSRTIMVATIGPASFNWDETITTLRYASRAKKIKNKPKVNEDPKDALLRQYQEEIERLRVELEKKKSKQAHMLQQSQQSETTERKKKQHNSSSSNNTSANSESNKLDLQRQVEEQRLRELAPLLEPYGLDPTTEPAVIMEKLAERRKELLQDNLTVKAEKDKLLKKLDETESLVKNTEVECAKLNERIVWLESKVLTGGKDLVDHTNEQQKLIQAKQQELAEQIERYEQMKLRLQEGELSIEELRVNAEVIESELHAKIKKLKKLSQKLQGLKEETDKTHENHTMTVRELETVAMELKKEFSLKRMIIDNFIPPASRKLIEKRMTWNPEKEEYKVMPLDSSHAVPRPPIYHGMKLPLYNISENGVVHMMENVHFRNENILQLHPELPKRRTKDYVPPSTDPYVSSLMRRAIDDLKKDVVLDCANLKRPPTGSIPQPMGYFKMGDQLIRPVKSARPMTRTGDQGSVVYHDFTMVNASSVPNAKIEGEISDIKELLLIQLQKEKEEKLKTPSTSSCTSPLGLFANSHCASQQRFRK